MNFELYHAGFDIRFSGSTCVMVTLFGDRLLCANVGDSRAVLARVYSGCKGLFIVSSGCTGA